MPYPQTTSDVLPIARHTGLSCHSQAVKPGHLFFAIPGRKTDGTLFIPLALAKGATAVVVDHVLPKMLPVPTYIVPNIRRSLALTAAEYFGFPSRSLQVTGITGSNGKTTTAAMLNHILTFARLRTGLIGTTEIKVDRQRFPAELTTPDSITLQHYLAHMRTVGVTHVTMEVSAQGMEMERVTGMDFTCGIFTNVCPDHLDFHGTFARYLESKKRFFSLMGTETPVIINTDDPICQEMVPLIHGQPVTVSLQKKADIWVQHIHTLPFYSSFRLRTCNLNLPIVLHLPGLHNIYNAMSATAAALYYGINPSIIQQAFDSFTAVERRLEFYPLNDITVLDDTALNPGSLDAVFNVIEKLHYLKLIIVNAIRGRRGEDINTCNATTLANWSQKLQFSPMITASADQVGAADRVSDTEQAAFLRTLDQNRIHYTYFPDLHDALNHCLPELQPGTLLVLLGAQGMDHGRKIITALTSQATADPPSPHRSADFNHKFARDKLVPRCIVP